MVRRLGEQYVYVRTPLSLPTRFSKRLQAKQYPHYGGGVCFLENLIPELRLLLLHTLPFKSLRVLVYASPVFHADYRTHRRSLLLQYLVAKLGIVIFDAAAVHHSSLDAFRVTRTPESVLSFIESYQRCRTSEVLRNFTKHLTEDEVVDMVGFYRQVTKFVIVRFLKMMTMWLVIWLNDLRDSDDEGTPPPRNIDPDEWYDPGKELPLSSTELMRLYRALYRFQLCCNLFGQGRWVDCPETRRALESAARQFGESDIRDSFMSLYEPWEIEEIGCIYTLAEVEVDSTLEKCREDGLRAKAEAEGLEEEIQGLDELNKRLNGACFRGIVRGTISRGAELISAICGRSIEENWCIIGVMQDQLVTATRAFLDTDYGAMSEDSQYRITDQISKDRLNWQMDRKPMQFIGDGDTAMDDLRPPWVWTQIWGEKYSMLYGYWIPTKLRLWGYVMWDASRLKKNGAARIMRQQWEEHWEGDDPRDIFDYEYS